jgi:hypothetical protein
LKGEPDIVDVDALIAAGEGVKIEFKSSLRCDLDTGNVNRELTKVVAKAMAGFLNAHGGTLLIGIGDDGSVTGIEADIATLSRKGLDGFQQTLRMALGKYLGIEVTPSISVAFLEKDGRTVASVECSEWHQPVFFQDGEKLEFYVRDGNLTRPLDVRASYEYIAYRWPGGATDVSSVKELVADALRELGGVAVDEDDSVSPPMGGATSARPEEVAGAQPEDPLPSPLEAVEDATYSPRFTEEENAEASSEVAVAAEEIKAIEPILRGAGEVPPPWLRVATRRVLNLFLRQLAASSGWKRLYIISPWISEITEGASLPFDLLLRRLKEDRTTVYVVTRPPEERWHEIAIARLADTGRANIAFVSDLHVKLYTAVTSQGAFAMLGSANFTQQSLTNREIGLLVNAYLEGKGVVRELDLEASQIYRMPGRILAHKADFRAA